MEISPAFAGDGATKIAIAKSMTKHSPKIGTSLDTLRCFCEGQAGNSLLNPTSATAVEVDGLNARLLFMGSLIYFSDLTSLHFVWMLVLPHGFSDSVSADPKPLGEPSRVSFGQSMCQAT
jgi:hypothetical protein